jgi:hypothetical protein
VALLCTAPGTGRAEEGPSVWRYSFYKTLTYEVLANSADFLLYATTVLGGTVAGAAPFLVVNGLAAASAYGVAPAP